MRKAIAFLTLLVACSAANMQAEVILRVVKVRNAQFGKPLVGCGALTDDSTCGQRASVETYPAIGTALPASSTCATINAAISSGTPGIPNVYYAVQDIGTSGGKNAPCLTYKADVTINLRHFTHYGTLCRNGNGTGWIVENGTWWGDANGTSNACGGQGGVLTFTNVVACPANQVKVLDVIIRNDSSSGADQPQTVHWDGSYSSDCASPPIFIDHVDSQTPPLAGGSRTSNIYIAGSQTRTSSQGKITNSKISFLAGANAQQGIVFSNCAYCEADHNLIDAVEVNAGLGDSGRAIDIDGQAGGTTGSAHARFTNNHVKCNNNRCDRVRNSYGVVITGNVYDAVETANGFNGACHHLGDPDTGSFDLGPIDISGNNCELKTGGWGGWLRDAFMTGGVIQNNTFTCHSSGCTGIKTWFLRQSVSTGTRSEWCVKNDTYIGLTANNQVQYGRTGDSAPVFTYSGITTPVADTSAGTVVAPTITNSGSCP